jgi:hypothetical protein
MPRPHVNLNDHLNHDIVRGNPADFPVALRPISYDGPDGYRAVPRRQAVVRQDTGEAIAVVSNRYTLVPHTRILQVLQEAIQPLDLGPVPRGIYVDRWGARMRAIFKFPALARPVLGGDDICPCLEVSNTYDGTSRVSVHIGAFRFVCTNLAVGGGGVFAGGFMSIHAGEIVIERFAERLTAYLTRFDDIVGTYRAWSERPAEPSVLEQAVDGSLNGHFKDLRRELLNARPATVFDAYNLMTDYATHRTRSATSAFALLERVNSTFQDAFPVRHSSPAALTPVPAEPKAEALVRAI